ncbi:hypothetical protein FOMPIDRAFT_1137615, partial [Fomitopsis schrenkii]
HLSVIDVVVSLCISHGLGPICDRVPQSVWKLLRYDSTRGVPRRIHLYTRRTYGFRDKHILQRLEGFSLLWSPAPGNVVQRTRCLSEVADEAAIEVGEPKESTQLAKILGCWPLGDCFDFYVIHLDLPFADYEAQVLYTGLLELALLGS